MQGEEVFSSGLSGATWVTVVGDIIKTRGT